MAQYKVETKSEKETIELAIKLAKYLEPGDVITLEGDLGTGKTTFTKGLGQGLGVEQMITSPTFTIVKEYEGTLPLYHMDAYRLEGSDEDIGFTEYFYGDGVSVVEWAQYIDEFLPENRLDITIQFVDEQTRVITFQPRGLHFEAIIGKLLC